MDYNPGEILLAAAEANDIETVKWIIANHDINFNVDSAIYKSVQFKDNVIFKLLLPYCRNRTGISYSIVNGNVEAMIMLLDKFGTHDMLNISGMACSNGELECVKVLVERYHANQFNFVLRGAIENRHYQVAKYLIERGADNFRSLMKYDIMCLLNMGCYTHLKDLEFTKQFKAIRDKKQEEAKQVIDNLNLSNYDVNITNIITEYIPYELR